MGEDLSAAAKIGISLIILCSLIAMVFSLLTIMKNLTTAASSDLQNVTTKMQFNQYEEFDQKTVTGAQVLAIIDLKLDAAFGIFVNTKSPATSVTYGRPFGSTPSTTPPTTGYYSNTLPAGANNNNRVNLNKKGANGYVRSDSTFSAYLVLTASNEVIGIVCIEK